jgi:hypothetical protein
MRILVCGGRDFADMNFLFNKLTGFVLERQIPFDDIVIIEGGARGADTLARQWAESLGIKFVEYPADWYRHGRSAGPIRNKQMLTEGKPDLVIAFPGGKGTHNMIKQAVFAGVPTMSFTQP